MTRRLLVLPIAALLVALAAPGAAAATAAETTDQQLARAGVLVQSDFPAGWEESPRTKTSGAALDAAAAKVPTCKAFLAFSRANRKHPRAQSPNFDLSHSNVTNSVSVYPSDAKAEATVTTFSDERMPDCLQRLFNAAYKKELQKDPETAAQVDSISTTIAELPGIEIGDQVVVYQGTVDIYMKDGSTQIVALGFAATRVGRAVAGYSWTSDVDISDVLQPAIVASVARLHDSQSAS